MPCQSFRNRSWNRVTKNPRASPFDANRRFDCPAFLRAFENRTDKAPCKNLYGDALNAHFQSHASLRGRPFTLDLLRSAPALKPGVQCQSISHRSALICKIAFVGMQLANSRLMRVSSLILVSLFLAGCAGEQDWDMVSKQDFPAPDGKRIARVFEMCGYNTTGYGPQVSLRSPNEKLGKQGNVLAGGPGDTFSVRWLSSSNLFVEYHVNGSWSSYPTENNVNGVAITFRKQ